MRRGAGAVLAAVAAAAVLAGCESPTYPLPATDFGYEFRLVVAGGEEGSDSLVFHWDPGRTVRVLVLEAETPGRPSLGEAFRHARDVWTRAAVFAQIRLRATDDPSRADAVLRWSDTPSPLTVPPACGRPTVIGGAAATSGCVDRGATPFRLARWGRVDGGTSRIRMEVTVSPRSDIDVGRTRRLVTHEMGHVLGIMNHSRDPEDLMWGGVLASDTLTRSDRSTLSILYESRRDVFP